MMGTMPTSLQPARLVIFVLCCNTQPEPLPVGHERTTLPPTCSICNEGGAPLDGETVPVTVRLMLSAPPLLVPPSSVTFTVMTTTPVALATGVKVSRPLLPGLE